MKLVVDNEKINSNLETLKSSIESFDSSCSSFSGTSITCEVAEITSDLQSLKEKISEDLNKISTSSNEYTVLVSDCCSKYQENESKTQSIDLGTIDDIISNNSDLLTIANGTAATALTGLPSVELSSSSSGNLVGSTNEEQMWNYLKSKGFTDIAIAGIMGNLMQESGLRSDNVQNNMGYEDADYVNGIKDGTISEDSFVNDSRGFGIAQWTYYSRKQELYDTLGSDNIDSLSGQLDFMVSEMGDDLINSLNNATSTSEATQIFEETYEQAGTPNMSDRITNAETFYNEFTS